MWRAGLENIIFELVKQKSTLGSVSGQRQEDVGSPGSSCCEPEEACRRLELGLVLTRRLNSLNSSPEDFGLQPQPSECPLQQAGGPDL